MPQREILKFRQTTWDPLPPGRVKFRQTTWDPPGRASCKLLVYVEESFQTIGIEKKSVVKLQQNITLLNLFPKVYYWAPFSGTKTEI